MVDFVRLFTGKRHERPELVVQVAAPLGLLVQGSLSEWYQNQSRKTRLEREDKSFHNRNAAVLADGALAWLNIAASTPAAKVLAVELHPAIADQMLGFGMRPPDRAIEE
jgi:hypothetical protein